METIRWQYPGDPVATATIMTGREFLAATPKPREVVLTVGDRVDRWDLGDEITCDSCTENVGLEERCALSMNRLYCAACFAKWIAPYAWA